MWLRRENKDNESEDIMAVQSPIEFNTRSVFHRDDFAPLKFNGHWDNVGKAAIENTGSSTNITFEGRNVHPFIVGGPLGNTKYIFEQLHFHWADHDSSGCEHTIEGNRYSMEAHAVHYNSKYKDFAEAVNKQDGLAVTGFFVQALGDTDCPDFEKIVKGVRRISTPNAFTSIEPDCLSWINQQDLTRHYYTYKGSLTTPPFYESVTWIVYRSPIYVSRRQVAVFRNLSSEKNNPAKKIVNNYREVQTPRQTPTVTFVRACRLPSKL